MFSGGRRCDRGSERPATGKLAQFKSIYDVNRFSVTCYLLFCLWWSYLFMLQINCVVSINPTDSTILKSIYFLIPYACVFIVMFTTENIFCQYLFSTLGCRRTSHWLCNIISGEPGCTAFKKTWLMKDCCNPICFIAVQLTLLFLVR